MKVSCRRGTVKKMIRLAMMKQQIGSAIYKSKYWMQIEETITAIELRASAKIIKNTP